MSAALLRGVRERRLLDLLRAWPGRRFCARADADRLPARGPPLRDDGDDVRGGCHELPRGGRLLELRAAGIQRAGELHRRLGPDAQLHHHGRDLGVLRPALPRCLLGLPARQPRGHHRRDRDRAAALRHQHRRGSGVGAHQPAAGGGGLRDTAPAARTRCVPGPELQHPDRQRPVGCRSDLGGLLPLDHGRDDLLHRDRDDLEHGGGGAEPSPPDPPLDGPRRCGGDGHLRRASRGCAVGDARH